MASTQALSYWRARNAAADVICVRIPDRALIGRRACRRFENDERAAVRTDVRNG
jgi:hypothetical protein